MNSASAHGTHREERFGNRKDSHFGWAGGGGWSQLLQLQKLWSYLLLPWINIHHLQRPVCAALQHMEPGRKEKCIYFSKDKFLNLIFYLFRNSTRFSSCCWQPCWWWMFPIWSLGWQPSSAPGSGGLMDKNTERRPNLKLLLLEFASDPWTN